MACPFFIPTERLEDLFTFPDRLPLAAGFRGVCGAPGQMLVSPGEEELRDHCNLGHAACSRLPEDRVADSVRFSARFSGNRSILVRYVFELSCRPAGGGMLEYDERERRWTNPSPDDRLQRLAESFLEAWRGRQQPKAAAHAAHS